MKNAKSLLSTYIKIMSSAGRLLFYRNDEELSFIREWILKKNYPGKNNIGDTDVSSPENYIQNCTLCGDVKNKKPGWGNGKSGIMIIMNTPLNISIIEKSKLKDQSRNLLSKMISAINVDLKECYVTNLIKCESENTINRPGIMLKNCAPILIQEIREFNPKIIIIMGDDMPVKRVINQKKNILWYRIDHPINILKNTELKKPAWSTLKTIIADLRNIGEKDKTVNRNE